MFARSFAVALPLFALGCATPLPVAPGAATSDIEPPAKERPSASRTRRYTGAHRMWDRYRCGGACWLRIHGSSELELVLAPNGKATAHDKGERHLGYRAVDGRSGEVTRWDHQWSGSWSAGPLGWSIRLVAATSSCTRGAKLKSTSCKGPAKLHLHCVDVRLEVDDDTAFNALECRAREWDAQNLTLTPWILGYERPILVKDVRGHRSVLVASDPKDLHEHDDVGDRQQDL